MEAASQTDGLQIDTQLFDIASLSHIMLLKPDQHGNYLETFGRDALQKLYSISLSAHLDFKLEFPAHIQTEVDQIIKQAAHQSPELRLSRIIAISRLLNIACCCDYGVARVILGLASLLQRLPSQPIANILSISETDLWNNYFDPLLNPLLGDPERQLFLRWTNKITRQTRSHSSHCHPDAVVSILSQPVVFPTYTITHGYMLFLLYAISAVITTSTTVQLSIALFALMCNHHIAHMCNLDSDLPIVWQRL